jgi:hypothetical protein
MFLQRKIVAPALLCLLWGIFAWEGTGFSFAASGVAGKILYFNTTTNIDYMGYALQSPFSGAICEGTRGSSWSCTIPNNPPSFGIISLVSSDFDMISGTVSYSPSDWSLALNGTSYPPGSLAFKCAGISKAPYCAFKKTTCTWSSSLSFTTTMYIQVC